MDLIKIKSEILCTGIHSNKFAAELFKKQNPNEILKTGNNGIFIKLDGKYRILASIIHETNQKSVYSIDKKDDKYYLLKNDDSICQVEVLEFPDWIYSEIRTNRTASQIFVPEGEYFIHQAYKGCDYANKGVSCKFCGTGKRDAKLDTTPEELGIVSKIALDENSNYQICLGGGTYLPLSENAEFFRNAVKNIRKHNKEVPIWIEMVPPSQEEIKSLVDAGATSFGFNIEVWDDEKRKEVCPGKSSFSKEYYIEALKYAKTLVGDNKVGSCLIAGLDTIESIKEGIDFLTSIGVHPCILPFRPYDGSTYVDREPCDVETYHELTEYATNSMIENHLNPFANEGCLLCDCCTTLSDMYTKKLS